MDQEERSTPLVLSGPPRARGRVHGEALRRQIGELFAAWEREVRRQVGLGLRDYLDRFWRETDYLTAMERLTPDLVEEVRGIAEGAGLGFEDCLCLQCMDEHWHHLERLAASVRRGRDSCSGLAVLPRGGQPALLAQNLDLPKYLDGFQVLLRIEHPDSDLVALVASYPGLVGLAGLTSGGLGVCVNTLAQLRTGRRGLPVSCVIRGLLERADLAEARAFLEGVPHAAGQAYLLGTESGVAAFECSAGKVARLEPPAGSSLILHTNHPLVSDDLREDQVGWDDDRAAADAEHGRTFTRLEALSRGLGGEGPVTVSRIEALLASTEGFLCRMVDGPFEVVTFCSVIYELRGAPRLHLAPGPPAVARFRAIGFD